MSQSQPPSRRAFVAVTVALCVMGLDAPATQAQDTPFGKRLSDIQVHTVSERLEAQVIRELVSRVGGPYLADTARRDAERLDRLGMFSAVEMRPVVEGDTVVLHVDVVETLRYLPLVSIDVNDEDGVSLGPGLKSVDFLGRGIFLSSAARFGGATQIELIAEDRWVGDDPFYQVQFFYRDRDNEIDAFDERSLELDLRVGGYLSDTATVGGTAGVLSLRSDTAGATLSSGARDSVWSLGGFVGQDSVDSRTNPHRGWLNELAVARHRGSGAGFWRLTADVRRFQPIAERHTLVLSSVTTLQSGRTGADIPIYRDFHLGGANTIRGWDLDAARGKNEHITTTEYRYTLVEPRDFTVFGASFYAGLQAAAFTDVGIAWDDAEELAVSNLVDGYGFGLRVLLPFVDIVRLDFAFGQPDEGLQRHIAVLEKAAMQRRRVR
jgi:outer membrane protein assembly factor BamA